ncbi:MAG: hypothetical protein QNJ74_05150 [Trichodesmium sp. MO_231.B1]|nr:hypothetical protein [Trichodesmium sp. MO_231.B1]
MVYEYLPEIFQNIKDIFIEIFETVEDIKIESLLNLNDKIYEPLTDILKESRALSLK